MKGDTVAPAKPKAKKPRLTAEEKKAVKIDKIVIALDKERNRHDTAMLDLAAEIIKIKV